MVKMQKIVELKRNPGLIASYIDHTNVNPNSTPAEIRKLCAEAVKYKFCSAVVLPYYARLARKLLKGSGVKTVTVIGFPYGVQATKAKVAELKEVLPYTDELDMVMNRPAFKAKDYAYVFQDIQKVVRAAKKPVKVIIESPELTISEIKRASSLVLKSGAAFVKTAVGLKGPAKISHVKAMAEVVKGKIGIKASGGIRTFQQALAFIRAGASRIGTSHGTDIIKSGLGQLVDKRRKGYFHE